MSVFSIIKGYLKHREKVKDELTLQAMAIGITSSVDELNDLHIVMLDFDTKDIKKVESSVKELQEFWHLSDAYIYQTKNGHHVLFYFDQVPYERCRMIIDYAKDVDPMFKYISRFYLHKTLRTAGKHDIPDIKYLKMICGSRTPSLAETRLGQLKRDEHLAMLKCERVGERK